VQEAAGHVAAWQALADHAADANPFYEPWGFLPALECFGAEASTQVVFVRCGEELIGVFPLQRCPPRRGLPLPHLAAWRHSHLFLASPLVAADRAVLAWKTLLAWARGVGAPLLDLTDQPAEGATAESALEAAGPGGALTLERFERPLLLRDEGDAESYLARASSSGSRKNWRRLRRRLSEQGRLELRALGEAEAPGPWIDAFLSLEARGWKGRGGTSLTSRDADARYFRAMSAAAHERGALHVLGLFLDGAPVAMQVNLFCAGKGFALKVAFDETWARFSPGVLLEIDAIHDCWEQPGFEWMDSCASPRNRLMGRLWSGTRAIERRLIATGRAGRCALTAAALGRRLRSADAPPEAPR
jgi:CelD/BcsL family acetyltransferase involved in cellulose biosynthesis